MDDAAGRDHIAPQTIAWRPMRHTMTAPRTARGPNSNRACVGRGLTVAELLRTEVAMRRADKNSGNPAAWTIR